MAELAPHRARDVARTAIGYSQAFDGKDIFPRDAEWAMLRPHFPDLPGARQIVVLAVESLQTSCGFGVPFYTFEGARSTLVDWAEKKGIDGLADYRRKHNRVSIDGLPNDTVVG